jgi:hypothetical protein
MTDNDDNVPFLIFAIVAFVASLVFFLWAWSANGQGFPGCPPACGPGVYMPLPRGPYLYDYPPLRFQRRYGPGVDMPIEEPMRRYRGNELLDEFNTYRRMPLYPQSRRPRWDE